MSLHALVEKWRAQAAFFMADKDYQVGTIVGERSRVGAMHLHQCADELEAALAGGGEAVYQCMCTDEDHIRNGPRDVWMDVDEKSFARLSIREDMRSRVLYQHPAGAVQVDQKLAEAIIAGVGNIPYQTLTVEDVMSEVNAALNPGGSRE